MEKKTIEQGFYELRNENKTVSDRTIPRLQIPTFTKKEFEDIFKFCLNGKEYVHNKSYDEVIEWIKDNKGKGLRLTGKKGLGKSIIAAEILPYIFKKYHRKIITIKTAIDISTELEVQNLKDTRFLVLDEVGVEGKKVDFGTVIHPVEDILDSAEKKGNLLIITYNLDFNKLNKHYDDGDRTAERIIATTHKISFEGTSLRK